MGRKGPANMRRKREPKLNIKTIIMPHGGNIADAVIVSLANSLVPTLNY